MIFKELLDSKTRELGPIFDSLHNLCGSHQTHYADLFLIHENGSFDSEVEKWDNLDEKMSPYITGPNNEGFSAYTHHDFIGDYIKRSTSRKSFQDYLSSLEYDERRKSEIEQLLFEESITVQIEMLIYLKVWESDIFIKQLYQLSLLLNGEPYDWHFRLKGYARDNGTGTRQLVIGLIIEKMRAHLPLISDIIETVYNTQLRNAIAHSQYWIMNRYLNLNNYSEKDPNNNIISIALNDWVDWFHYTLVIYSQLQRLLHEINFNYGIIARNDDGKIEIRISQLHPKKETRYRLMNYRG